MRRLPAQPVVRSLWLIVLSGCQRKPLWLLSALLQHPHKLRSSDSHTRSRPSGSSLHRSLSESGLVPSEDLPALRHRSLPLLADPGGAHRPVRGLTAGAPAAVSGLLHLASRLPRAWPILFGQLIAQV